MLLAVEGGGFFTSSATGYSKGLALLLLGHKNEERPLRVSPWNHYRLVDQEVDPDLGTKKKLESHGCTSFFCFGCGSSELHRSSLPVVGSSSNSDPLAHPNLASEERKSSDEAILEKDSRACPKSSLKKQFSNCAATAVAANKGSGSIEEARNEEISCEERRRVHWTDSCGRELAEIREFEVSEELETCEGEINSGGGGNRKCQCLIM